MSLDTDPVFLCAVCFPDASALGEPAVGDKCRAKPTGPLYLEGKEDAEVAPADGVRLRINLRRCVIPDME